MIMLGTGYTLESISPLSVGRNTLERIFEIEQDMWSRGIGEYVRCNSCEAIYSKQDIYGDDSIIQLPSELQRKTVKEIEEKLGGIPGVCNGCSGELQHIYDRELYLPEIQSRYNTADSFLTVSRDREGKIIGFMDGYIATLEEIFHNEFRHHFTSEMQQEICDTYKLHRNRRLLTVSSIGTDDENKSLFLILELLKTFFTQFDDSQDTVDGIIESIIGSSTYCIFRIMGAKKLCIPQKPHLVIPDSQNTGFPTDILFQENVIGEYKKNFSVTVRDVVRYSKTYHSS